MVMFLEALTICSPGLAVPLGITRAWSGWDQRSCQKKRPILGNWGHGPVTRAYQDNLDYSGSSSEQRPNE